ncbi:hypothetical protein GCM10028805_40800 [Spirosoma harenae]
MKRLIILWILLPVASLAQDGERFLNATSSMLATNRSVRKQFFFAEKREKSRFDTMSTNAPNFRSRYLNFVWENDYESAVLWMEKTATLYPKEHGMVGEIYLNHLHDYSRAITHFDAYDALTPKFDDIIGYNPVSYMRGLAYRGLGNHEKALEQFSKAIDSLINKHGTEWVNYKHFISRAVSYIATKQPEKALADLDKALKNYSRSALAYYHRGRALVQLNRMEEAQTAFQDASFFCKALRAERKGNYQEDDFNPMYESEIDEALTNLKNVNR